MAETARLDALAALDDCIVLTAEEAEKVLEEWIRLKPHVGVDSLGNKALMRQPMDEALALLGANLLGANDART